MGLQNIIEFLMENLFFLFIVLSGLFSLFKRNQTQENNEQKRKSFPTTSQNDPNPFEIEVNDTTDPVFVPTETKPTTNHFETEQTVNPFYEQLKKREQEKVQQSETINNPTNRIKLENTSETRRYPNVNIKQNISRKKVIDGIIWAEILGKPRARKKHTFPGYYHKD